MVVSEAGYLIPESGFPPSLRDFKASKRVVINIAIAQGRAYDVLKKIDTIKAETNSVPSAFVWAINNVIPLKPLTDKEVDVKARARTLMVKRKKKKSRVI